MAISWPFDSTVTQGEGGSPIYSRAYSNDVIAQILTKYFRNGVFANPYNSLQVLQNTGMTVKVKAGAANINGRQFYEENDRVLAVQAAHATLDRIDTLVLRLNLELSMLTIDFSIVQGTAAATPSAPTLTRNASVWELGLANLLIAKEATTVTQAHITDTRMDNERCGFVVSVVDDVGTEVLYQQIQADLAAFKANEQTDFISWSAEQKAAFDGWMATLQAELAGDVAALLTARVQALEAETIGVYAHVRSTDGIHRLTMADGISRMNGRVKITAEMRRGDTFEVNGAAVKAYAGRFELDENDDLPVDRWVSFVYDAAGAQVNFNLGGGGARLKVISVASASTLPVEAKDGVVAVVTSEAIREINVQTSAPPAAMPGDLWIDVGRHSVAPISLMVKGVTVWLYPIMAKQWDGGAWNSRNVYTRVNGAWVPWATYLYNNGIANAEMLSEWKWIFHGVYYPNATWKAYNTYTEFKAHNTVYTNFSTTKTIDLTPYSLAVVKGYITKTRIADNYVRLGAGVATAQAVDLAVGDRFEIQVDIASIMGRESIDFALNNVYAVMEELALYS